MLQIRTSWLIMYIFLLIFSPEHLDQKSHLISPGNLDYTGHAALPFIYAFEIFFWFLNRSGHDGCRSCSETICWRTSSESNFWQAPKNWEKLIKLKVCTQYFWQAGSCSSLMHVFGHSWKELGRRKYAQRTSKKEIVPHSFLHFHAPDFPMWWC